MQDVIQARSAMCFWDPGSSLGQLLFILFCVDFFTLTSVATVMYQGGKTVCYLAQPVCLVDVVLCMDCC